MKRGYSKHQCNFWNKVNKSESKRFILKAISNIAKSNTTKYLLRLLGQFLLDNVELKKRVANLERVNYHKKISTKKSFKSHLRNTNIRKKIKSAKTNHQH